MTESTNNKNGDPLYCPYYALCPNDLATKLAHLGWRFVYTLIAWFILGFGIKPGNNFFLSIVLFTVPLLMDYLKFEPKQKIRKYIKRIGVSIAGIFFILGILGLTGIFEIVNNENVLSVIISNEFVILKGRMVSLSLLWILVGLCVILTGIDWLISESNLEKRLVKGDIPSTDSI